jgi:AHBA synthesis associated protein
VTGRAAAALQVVIFDLDGVLVDSFDVMRQAFAVAYAEVVGDGQPPFDEYRKHMGRYFPDIMRIMNLPLEMEGPFVRESYRLAGQVAVYDGVREMLRELRLAQLRLAVATGKSGPRARSLLAVLELLEMFDAVIGGDEVDHPKPAPDIVLEVLRRLAAPADAAIMIGDAPSDLRSARAAGVRAVAALWGEAPEADLLREAPDATLRSPSDVIGLCCLASRKAGKLRLRFRWQIGGEDGDVDGGLVGLAVDFASGVVLGDGALDDAGADPQPSGGHEGGQDEAADRAGEVDAGAGDDARGLGDLVAGGFEGSFGEPFPVRTRTNVLADVPHLPEPCCRLQPHRYPQKRLTSSQKG